jgi:hypothetical protein
MVRFNIIGHSKKKKRKKVEFAIGKKISKISIPQFFGLKKDAICWVKNSKKKKKRKKGGGWPTLGKT